ncbi:DNA-directed RNA polymerase I subunit RPA1-like [Homarus americanus]|uniref:DNA-directed RNA polymerase I subunit RPA1-like n=1 Tax=Homarus americanus TaxID=6706 RepID=UPI001C49527E|nr:DNA-directed RNA polymerase I subunit RPA1-like [Homarus americanus]
MNIVEDKFYDGRVTVGQSVGALAAQALAEPLMQMTLNAAHRASVASDYDTIPRLKELLNGTAKDLNFEYSLRGLPYTRRYIIQEISSIYENAGETIDRRHIQLVADYMLKDGHLKGFNRNQLNNSQSFLKSAAFEQPLKVLEVARSKNKIDRLRGFLSSLSPYTVFTDYVDQGLPLDELYTLLDDITAVGDDVTSGGDDVTAFNDDIIAVEKKKDEDPGLPCEEEVIQPENKNGSGDEASPDMHRSHRSDGEEEVAEPKEKKEVNEAGIIDLDKFEENQNKNPKESVPE